jgi:hypothetical protein
LENLSCLLPVAPTNLNDSRGFSEARKRSPRRNYLK